MNKCGRPQQSGFTEEGLNFGRRSGFKVTDRTTSRIQLTPPPSCLHLRATRNRLSTPSTGQHCGRLLQGTAISPILLQQNRDLNMRTTARVGTQKVLSACKQSLGFTHSIRTAVRFRDCDTLFDGSRRTASFLRDVTAQITPYQVVRPHNQQLHSEVNRTDGSSCHFVVDRRQVLFGLIYHHKLLHTNLFSFASTR